jgi:hypothetical protein
MTVGSFFLSTDCHYAVANFHTPFLPTVADHRYNTVVCFEAAELLNEPENTAYLPQST